ncbi:hypothetical protein [Brevibacillus sp. H7]|uniref:hypothetical protein n=1 Tax=Brevibacillus sp. H7 TaxID=3349138 RepID=UPI0038049A52
MTQGVGTQIIFVLISWFTPVVFLMVPQIAYDYGVLGILGLVIMQVASFYLFFFWRTRLAARRVEEGLHRLVHFLYLTESVSCMLLAGKIVISQSLWMDSFFFFMVLLIVVFMLLGFAKNWFVKWIAVGVVVVGMIASFLIPTLVYLKISIPTVYSGLHFLATDMLKLDVQQTWLFILVLGISILVHHYLFYMYGGVSQIRTPKSFLSYLLASVLFAFVPISLGSLSFVAKAQAIWPELTDHVSLQVIEQFGGQFGKSLFLMALVVTIIYEIFRVKRSYSDFHQSYPKSLALLPIPLAIVFTSHVTLLDVVTSFCLLWGPLLPVLLWAKGSRTRMFIAFGLGAAAGIGFALYGDVLTGVLYGTCLSGVLLVPWLKWLYPKT